MLRRTFIHLPGVGAKREQALWQAGIDDWAAFLSRGEAVAGRMIYGLGRPVVEKSLAALEAGEEGLRQLAAMLPLAEHWRFWPTFDRVVFLDIETGGQPEEWGGITVVGLYDGRQVRQLVAGRDLQEMDQALRGAQVLVTFAGSSFDLPVLRGVFSRMYVPPVHVDLRWVCRRLGLKGGLKRIEKQLGLGRPDMVDGLNGLDAVRLWAAHEQGDAASLETLLQYNACDIINLLPLLRHAAAALRRGVLGQGPAED